MKTFFILLILISIPFVWFIRRMLRFTEDTVGEDSLVYGLDSSKKRTRAYQFSASQYFVTFMNVLCALVFIQMLVAIFVVAKTNFPQEPLRLLLSFVFTLALLAFAVFLIFYFYIDWKFWTITQNVRVTFDPHIPSIIVGEPTEFYILTPDTVSHIEHHLVKSSNPRYLLNGYGCLYFYKTDGQLIWLNNIFFRNFSQYEFLGRFFPGVPVSTIYHRFPYRSLIAHFESMQAPNFDPHHQR